MKKEALVESGGFPSIKVGEDTHLFLRLALACKLKAGNITSATGKRRVHGANSVLSDRKAFSQEQIAMYKDLIQWASTADLGFSVGFEIRLRMYLQYFKQRKY
jgi:hypothetical protein